MAADASKEIVVRITDHGPQKRPEDVAAVVAKVLRPVWSGGDRARVLAAALIALGEKDLALRVLG